MSADGKKLELTFCDLCRLMRPQCIKVYLRGPDGKRMARQSIICRRCRDGLGLRKKGKR